MLEPNYQEDYGEQVDASALPNMQMYNNFDENDDMGGSADVEETYILPKEVMDFIINFRQNLLSQNNNDIEMVYEHRFRKLTEKYYKDSAWPTAELIAEYVDNDKLFLTLYRELCFRHIYSKLKPTIDHRVESYENYCDLFNYILDSEEPVTLELPKRWLWDIIDEFIYQFQTFTQYRAQLLSRTEEERELLQANPQVWNVHIVLNVLHSLVEKSNINDQLKAAAEGADEAEAAGEFGSKTLYKMLGYFSLVGLLRLHVLLGDYYQALHVIEHIELNKKGLFVTVPACQITLFYYIGFSYMMMRRYQDAVRSFANILYYILRTQNYHTKSAGYDNLIKKRDRLFYLLAIVMSLCPQRIDEGVQNQLNEKCGELMQKIQKNEEGANEAYEELLKFGCPKFLSPVPPNYNNPSPTFHMEPFNLQVKLFMEEIKQQKLLPVVRSYLKLYSTIPISKLASFLKIDPEEFRINLLNYKHKTNQAVWSSGSPLSGTRTPSDAVDFYIDKDMVHIADVKVARCFGEYFIYQINKMNK